MFKKSIFILVLMVCVIIAAHSIFNIARADVCDQATINVFISKKKSNEELRNRALQIEKLRKEMKTLNFNVTKVFDKIPRDNKAPVAAQDIEDIANEAIKLIFEFKEVFRKYCNVARVYYVSPDNKGQRQKEIDYYNNDVYFQLYFQVITTVRMMGRMQEVLQVSIPLCVPYDELSSKENMYRKWLTSIAPKLLKDSLDFLLFHPYNSVRDINIPKRYDLFNHLKRVASNAILLSEKYPEDLDQNFETCLICLDSTISLHKIFGHTNVEMVKSREEQLLAIIKELKKLLKSQNKEALWKIIVDRYSSDFKGVMARDVFNEVDYSLLDEGAIKEGFALMGKKWDHEIIYPKEVVECLTNLNRFINDEFQSQEKYMWNYIIKLYNFFAKQMVEYSKTRARNYKEKLDYLFIAYNLVESNIDLYNKYHGTSKAIQLLSPIMNTMNAVINAEIEDADVFKHSGPESKSRAEVLLFKLQRQKKFIDEAFKVPGDTVAMEGRFKHGVYNTLKNANRAAMKCVDVEDYMRASEFIKIAYDIYRDHEALIRRMSVVVVRVQEANGRKDVRFETGRLKTNLRNTIKGLKLSNHDAYEIILNEISADTNGNRVRDYIFDCFRQYFQMHNREVINLKSA